MIESSRRAKIAGSADERYPAIADYALLSDCHSAALVSRHGSVDWASFHRFDAPSTFGRLLDWDRGGSCRLAPTGSRPAGRRYMGPTLILETDHRTGGSRGRTTDFLSISDTSHPSEAERVHPYHQLIRIADAVTGPSEWEFVCAPRFEYGIVHPRGSLLGEHLAVLIGGPEALVVNASVPLETGDGEVRARFRLAAGERAWFAITQHRAAEVRSEPLDGEEIVQRLAHTRGFWEEWAKECTYRGPYRDEVLRSALTLKALTNAPTGAIVAAPTTSLPEGLGGVRNWDYRFCWVRDATFALYALFVLGYRSEARAFIDWLARTTAGRSEDLQVLYGVGGERLLPEVILDHLEGYRGSRPVRTGNGAASQFQLDIYGEVLDTAHLWRKFGGSIDAEFWTFLRGCVECIAKRWRDPDEGIWEVRGGALHRSTSTALSTSESSRPSPCRRWTKWGHGACSSTAS